MAIKGTNQETMLEGKREEWGGTKGSKQCQVGETKREMMVHLLAALME